MGRPDTLCMPTASRPEASLCPPLFTIFNTIFKTWFHIIKDSYLQTGIGLLVYHILSINKQTSFVEDKIRIFYVRILN